MFTHEFEGCNVAATAPAGYEEMISTLHCFHNGRACVSAWKPDKETLEALNRGESIFVSVMSGSHEGPNGKVLPTIIPVFVGTEETCRAVVSDTGRTW